MKTAANLLYVHAPEDQGFCDALEKHLSSLKRDGLIESWHAGLLRPGAHLEQEWQRRIERSDVLLALLSADFLASDACWDLLSRGLQRQRAGTMLLIPVLLRAADCSALPIDKLSMLPPGLKAVAQWERQDDAWLEVVRGIRLLLGAAPAGLGVRDLQIRVWAEPSGHPSESRRNILILPKDARGDSFVVGERIRIGFQTNQDCYVLLINHGTSGQASVIYPQAEVEMGVFCRGDQCHYFPTAADRFGFVLQGPPGRERVRALARLPFQRLREGEREQFLKQVVPAGWAEASYEFQVAELARGARPGPN